MGTSAQGKDFSSYQAPVTSADLDGLAFSFTKATEGPGVTDPHFTANWATIKAKGIHRGAYHELWSAGSAPVASQAAHFLATVKAAGLERGDMLAVVASDYGGVTGAEVKAWCDIVAAACPGCKVLVYSDLSTLAALTSCTGYPLWAAWPSGTAPESVAPWDRWTFWQWGSPGGVDCDAFNGTPEELTAWLGSVAAPAPAPAANWTEKLVNELPQITTGSANANAVRTVQGLCGARGHAVPVDGSFGPVTEAAVRDVQAAAKVTVDGIVGPVTWGALLGV
jgi:GH25 family lysozyme M1 (1,4-beta-N-acetylmuramidase)